MRAFARTVRQTQKYKYRFEKREHTLAEFDEANKTDTRKKNDENEKEIKEAK